MNNISTILKTLREKNGLTQTQIAEIINLAQRTYSHYEKAEREPSIETIIKLSEYYKVSIDYLVKGGEENTQEEKEVLFLYRKLTEKNKGKAELYIEQLLEQQENQQAQAKEIA